MSNRELDKYYEWRHIGKHVNNKILDLLPKPWFLRAASDLRLYESKLASGESFDDIDYVFDRAIFDLRSKTGKSFIEIAYPVIYPKASNKERMYLNAMLQSYYSLFKIQEVVEGWGFKIKDLLLFNDFFLFDWGLSQNNCQDSLLSTRIICIQDIHFTSGCSCLFSPDQENFLLEQVKKQQRKTDKPKEAMRTCSAFFFHKMKKNGLTFLLI